MPDLSQVTAYVPQLTDALVYVFIALVTLTGLLKCLIPLWNNTHALRRAVRRLQEAAGTKRETPVWQEKRFMGRRLKGAWQRFLQNAEQLDRRGLPCSVEEYINDETVIHGPGNAQLAELIPSLLTSLGILGTFMGLTRGMSGLDFADSTALLEGIPTLLDGMKYAFETSVAGIACSLAFNMLNRIAVGSGYRAIDDFTESFTALAMQRPLDNDVQIICQNQDRNALITAAADGLANQMAGSVELAVSRALHPVAQSMDNFLVGATRGQVEGVGRIVDAFVSQMNAALDHQFLALGETLTEVNQRQQLSFERAEGSLQSAQAIAAEVGRLHQLSGEIMEQFQHYVQQMSQQRQQDAQFAEKAAALLEKLQAAEAEQGRYLQSVKGWQEQLEQSLSRFTQAGQEQLSAMRAGDAQIKERLDQAAQGMAKNARELSDSYASFVQHVVEGVSRALGMFDENMHELTATLAQQLGRQGGGSGEVVRQLSQMQQMMTAISASLERAASLLEGRTQAEDPAAEAAKGASA